MVLGEVDVAIVYCTDVVVSECVILVSIFDELNVWVEYRIVFISTFVNAVWVSVWMEYVVSLVG